MTGFNKKKGKVVIEVADESLIEPTSPNLTQLGEEKTAANQVLLLDPKKLTWTANFVSQPEAAQLRILRE